MRQYILFFALLFVLSLIYIFTQPGAQQNHEVEEDATLYAHELIKVTSPLPNGTIQSPLEVRGEARGYWFFEATAPVVIVDWDGLIIAEGYIEAEGDWMTEEFVPFTGTIEFDVADIRGGYSNEGTIIFHNHNASDLPEHDEVFEFPITFSN
jgi:hypothetical protein